MNKKYQEVLSQFFHTEKITDYSLDKIRSACEYFGNPQDTFKSIHIAGTNGKGSTAKMIFQMLKESGKRVGVFTSPHNIDIRERFETEIGLISQTDFVRIAEKIIDYGYELSSYERYTLLAFLYFREHQCEYAVIEVGMGGRLDATNIITPILSIITSISYDHMEFLGNTLEKIAYEKGGIIKPGVPVILYHNNPTLEDIAGERNSEIIFPKKRSIKTNLLGEHQISNGQIAYEAGMFLGLTEETIQNALLHVDHHGRLDYIYPNLLIDGAHNEDGMKKLKFFLDSEKENWQEVVYCFALKKGKPVSLVFENLPDISDFILVDVSHPMVEKASNLADQLKSLDTTSAIMIPEKILTKAQKNPEKLFVVFGSLYMIGEFLSSSQYE